MYIYRVERATDRWLLADETYLLCSGDRLMKLKDFVAYVHSRVFTPDAPIEDDFAFHNHFRDYECGWVVGETDIELTIMPKSKLNECVPRSNIIDLFDEQPISADTFFSQVRIVWDFARQRKEIEALEDGIVRDIAIADWLICKYEMESLLEPAASAISDALYDMHRGQRDFNVLTIISDCRSSSTVERTLTDIFDVDIVDDPFILLSETNGNGLRVLQRLVNSAYSRIEAECGFSLRKARSDLDHLQIPDSPIELSSIQYRKVGSSSSARKFIEERMLGGCFDVRSHSFVDAEFIGIVATPDELNELFIALEHEIKRLKTLVSATSICSIDEGIQLDACRFEVAGNRMNLLIYS